VRAGVIKHPHDIVLATRNQQRHTAQEKGLEVPYVRHFGCMTNGVPAVTVKNLLQLFFKQSFIPKNLFWDLIYLRGPDSR
jgi:hypothetical protein